MIKDGQGNLFGADAEALVNTVNTVGYIGKGFRPTGKPGSPWEGGRGWLAVTYAKCVC